MSKHEHRWVVDVEVLSRDSRHPLGPGEHGVVLELRSYDLPGYDGDHGGVRQYRGRFLCFL